MNVLDSGDVKGVASTTVDRFRNASSVNDLIRLLRGDAGLGDFRIICGDDGTVVLKLLNKLIRVRGDSDEYVSEFILGVRSNLLPVLVHFHNLLFVRSKVDGFVPTLEELDVLPFSKARRYLCSMKEGDERIAWPLVDRCVRESSMGGLVLNPSRRCVIPSDASPGYSWVWVDNFCEAGWLEVDFENRRQGEFIRFVV